MNIRRLSIILSVFLFFVFSSGNEIFAKKETGIPSPRIIHTFKEDITGDGMEETIQLYGTSFTNDSAYYKDIFIKIKSNNHEWKINYGGGFKPNLQFLDINHDKIKDLIYQSKREGDIIHTQIHHVKYGDIQTVQLPKQHIAGEFLDNFKINIHLTPLDNPHTIDIKKNAEKYIDSGLYKENGKLQRKNTILKIQPKTTYESIQLSDSQGYGLKSSQQIHGTNKQDPLGFVETLWYFEDEKWIILQTKWVEK